MPSKPRLARRKSQALSVPSFRAWNNQPWKGQGKIPLLAWNSGKLGRVLHLSFKHPVLLAVVMALDHVDNFSWYSSPFHHLFPNKMIPGTFSTASPKWVSDNILSEGWCGYFTSVEIWWTVWAFLDFCCNRRRFLRAWTKDVLFLLMNKLPAAKQNITKLNRTECVLHFKKLILFWQESKANVNTEDKSERTKSHLSRPVRNRVSLMDTSTYKTCLSS